MRIQTPERNPPRRRLRPLRETSEMQDCEPTSPSGSDGNVAKAPRTSDAEMEDLQRLHQLTEEIHKMQKEVCAERKKDGLCLYK